MGGGIDAENTFVIASELEQPPQLLRKVLKIL